MKNKAYILIDDCFDCSEVTRGNHFDANNPTALDDIYCDLAHRLIIPDPNYDVVHVPIPDWCPRLFRGGVIINKPKELKIIEEK